MKIFAEKEAESFLRNKGFEVVKSDFVLKQSQLKPSLEKIGFPLVMKVSGKKIIHKNKLNGIILNITSLEQAEKAFNRLIAIPNAEGVLIQQQIKGEEFLLGIKKTPEFSHVLAFGAGGIHTEQLKDVSFRVCPLTKTDAEEMIREVKSSKNLNKNQEDKISNLILKLSDLIKSNPEITELDINPLIVNNSQAIIVDARMAGE